MYEISFIIVNYNTTELTINAIESINKFCVNSTFEIVVVDNSEFISDILKNYKNIKYIKTPKNLGFGVANNLGFEHCAGEYIFLLNSDAYFIDDKSIEIMKEYLNKNMDVACVGGNLLYPNGIKNISYGNFLNYKRMLYNFGLFKCSEKYFKDKLATAKIVDFDEPCQVEHLTGAAIMLKSKIIKEIGLFNPKYFMYLEDMDLGFKLMKNGYKSVLIPQAEIVHLGGQSGTHKSSFIPLWITNEIRRSKYLFLENNTHFLIILFLKTYEPIFELKKKIFKKVKWQRK